MKARVHGTRLMLPSGMAVALAIGMLAAGPTAYAAQAPVGLGTAGSFAVLAGVIGVTNTGPTTITGDVGIHPGTVAVGFNTVTLHGTLHAGDAVALQAKNDLTTAYTDAAGRTPFTAVPTELGGTTLKAGVYRSDTLGLTGTLTLDAEGNPNAVFIFQAASTLITASGSKVDLINGASLCNVYWQVGSSATLAKTTSFQGTILALTSITLETGATLQGRALARNGAVTLDNNVISNAACSAAPSPSPSATPSPSPKLTYTGSTAAAPGASITLRATLKTSAGVAIAGKTVTFTLNGVTGSAKTSRSGLASVVTKAPTALGTYPIKIAFAGDTTHAAASTTASFRVRTATSGQALPNTATLATTDLPGPGPTPVVFVGILLLAFVVASRLLLRASRTR